MARYRALLIDGPVLELPLQSINFSFDPNSLVPLERAGTLYPTLTASDWWGSVQATTGALISPDFKRLTLPKPDPANLMTGQGWTLTLKPGWTIVPCKRLGDYIAVKG